jgi:hypothetical protein
MASAKTISVTSPTVVPPRPTLVGVPARETVVVAAPERAAASSRPTSRPDTELALLAEAGQDFRTPAFVGGQCPLMMNVPILTGRGSKGSLGHREAFLLMHVDGISEIATISKLVGLPLNEVVSCFRELEAAGLVALTIPEPAAPGDSGVFLALPRRDDDPF